VTRYLGIDYGTKRVGLALSDGLGITARPLEVVPRSRVGERVVELCAEHGVDMLVVGLPTGLNGQEGAAVAGARALGEELAELTGLPVTYIDERFTSKLAESALLESGMRRRSRRDKVDKVAAAIILQSFLDRRSGNSADV
jgi:putative Holliday junction resolvase